MTAHCGPVLFGSALRSFLGHSAPSFAHSFVTYNSTILRLDPVLDDVDNIAVIDDLKMNASY
jgi:hypothetical protein